MITTKIKTIKRQNSNEAEAAEVLRKFRQIFNSVKNHFQQVEKKAGIGGAQVWALSLIRENPSISVNDLSNLMDIHQSTASNLIKSLVKSNLIDVKKNDVDKRTIELKINTMGKRILKKAPLPFSAFFPMLCFNLILKFYEG